MLARGTRAKSCLVGIETSSFAPFLYQTRTILPNFPPSRTKTTFASNDTRSGEREEKSRRKDKAPRKPRSSGEQNERPRPIPFEGKLPYTDLGARVEGSTMTPKELRIFEELFKAKRVQADDKTEEKQTQKPHSSPKAHKVQSKRQNATPEPPSREFPDLLRPLAEEAAAIRAQAAMEQDTKGSKGTVPSEAEQDESVLKRLEFIRSSMNTAKTDFALWNILQDQVFEPIERLTTSSNAARSNREFQILAQTLPQSLLHFMKTVRRSFPGSSTGLVVLSTLKKLGPSAFALGASTELFNAHMRLLYDHYADLDGIAETLSEMDKNVYEFDADTRDLIATILRDGRKALNNNYGPGMQALWSTDRKTRGLAKLRRWDEIVGERLKAAALRAAREQQNEFEEDDEGDQKLAVA